MTVLGEEGGVGWKGGKNRRGIGWRKIGEES